MCSSDLFTLHKREEFRRQFVLTFMDMANECFRPSHVLPLLDRLEEQYEDAAAKSYERWNTEPSDAAFTEQAEELRTFFANRYDAIVPCLAAHFSLTGDLVPVALSSNAPEGGTVTLNTLTPDLSASVWSGSYYTDYPIRLTASPAEGYIFTGWETTDCEPLTAGSSPVLEVRLRDNSQPSIKAVFEKLPSNRQ